MSRNPRTRTNYKSLMLKSKSEKELSLSKTLLHALTAVGFVLAPVALPVAHAEIVRVSGETFLNNGKNTANIYAEQVNAQAGVGVNTFRKFDVANNQVANIMFQQQGNNKAVLNTVINMVNSQINVAGTVNAIRNNQVGGNLLFLSPQGMVVSGTGVINAGSLTVMTPTQDFFTKAGIGTKISITEVSTQKQVKDGDGWKNDGSATTKVTGKGEFITGNLFPDSLSDDAAKDAYQTTLKQFVALQGEALAKGKTLDFGTFDTSNKTIPTVEVDIPLSGDGSIVVHGKLNAATAMSLVASTIDISKEEVQTTAPTLKTGVAFSTVVNTNGTDTTYTVTENGTLSLSKDGNNVVLVDPSNPSTENISTSVKTTTTESKTLTVQKDDIVTHTKEKESTATEVPKAKDDTKIVVTTTTTTSTKLFSSEYATSGEASTSGTKLDNVKEDNMLTALKTEKDLTDAGYTASGSAEEKDNTKTQKYTKNEKSGAKETTLTATLVSTRKDDKSEYKLTKTTMDDTKVVKSREEANASTAEVTKEETRTEDGTTKKYLVTTSTETTTVTRAIDNAKDPQVTVSAVTSKTYSSKLTGDGSINISAKADKVNYNNPNSSGWVKFLNWFGSYVDISKADGTSVLKESIKQLLGVGSESDNIIEQAISNSLKTDDPKKVSVQALWGSLSSLAKDTAKAEINVGSGATIAAKGIANVIATATSTAKPNSEDKNNLANYMANTMAIVNVNGTVTGADVKIASTAKSTFSADAAVDAGNVLFDNKKIESLTHFLPDALTTNNFVTSIKNLLNEVHLGLAVVSSQAETNINADSNVSANAVTSGGNTIGSGKVDIAADSSSTATLAVGLQVANKKTANAGNGKIWLNGGLGLESLNSSATVNINKQVTSGAAMNVAATSATSATDKLAILKPGTAASDTTNLPAYMNAAFGVILNENKATINIGSATVQGSEAAPLLNATGALAVTATTDTKINSVVGVQSSDDQAVGTAVSIVDTNADAVVNNYAYVKGAGVSVAANNNVSQMDISTNNAFGTSDNDDVFTDLSNKVKSIFSKEGTKENVKAVATSQAKSAEKSASDTKDAKNTTKGANQEAALTADKKDATGGGVSSTTSSGSSSSSWSDYFDLGASVMVVNGTNNATVNLQPTSVINADTSALNIAALTKITDPKYRVVNTLTTTSAQNSTTDVAISAAVGVVNMDNTATVNALSATSGSTTTASQITGGNVTVNAKVDDHYQRVDAMVNKVNNNIEQIIAKLNNVQNCGETVKTNITDLVSKLRDFKLATAGDDVSKIISQGEATTESFNKLFTSLKTLTSDTTKKQLQSILTDAKAFLEPTNYASFYVHAGFLDKGDKASMPLALTGTVGVQNIHDTANVNVGKNASINATKITDVTANVLQGSVMEAGKTALATSSGAKVALGGTVAVANNYNNSAVSVEHGATITGDKINITTANEVMNLNTATGGARTSTTGITGMVSYLGGESTAKTFVDDDANITVSETITGWDGENTDESYRTLLGVPTLSFTGEATTDAQKEEVRTRNKTVLSLAGYTEDKIKVNAGIYEGMSDADAKKNMDTYLLTGCKSEVDSLLSSDGAVTQKARTEFAKYGSLNVTSANNTVLTNFVGNVNTSAVAAVGASVGIISYDVTSLAQVKNLDTTTAAATGIFTAKNATVSATTDGVINNLTVAGVSVAPNEKALKPNERSGDQINGIGTKVRDKDKGKEIEMQDLSVNSAGKTEDNKNQNAAAPTNDDQSNVKVDKSSESEGGNARAANENDTEGKKQNNSKLSIAASGSVSWNDIKNETTASLEGVTVRRNADNAALEALNVSAVDSSYIGAYSGAMALTKAGNVDSTGKTNTSGFSASLAGAVAVNDLVKTASADIKKATLYAVNVNNNAQNSGVQVAAGIALGLATKANKGLNVAGSGSVNFITSTVEADMEEVDASQQTTVTSVNNTAYDKDIQIAGGVNVNYTKNSVGIGAAVTVNNVKNTINAKIANSNLGSTSYALDHVSNLAVSKLTQIGGAVSVGVAIGENNYFNANAAVAANTVVNNVTATGSDNKIYTKKFTSEARDGVLTTNETDATYTQRISDLKTLGFDADGAEAIRTANNNDAGFKSSADSEGNLQTVITPDEDDKEKKNTTIKYTATKASVNKSGNLIVGTAMGVSPTTQGNVAAGAGVVYDSINNSFNSKLSRSNIITPATSTGAASAVNINAASDSLLVTVAGGVALKGTSTGAAVAGSVAIATTNNDTKVDVDHSNITACDAQITAKNKATLTTVAGLVNASLGTVAAGMTWAQNNLNNTTGVYYYDSDLTASAVAVKPNFTWAALNEGETWAIGMGVAAQVGKGVAQGAFAANNGYNNTESVLDTRTGYGCHINNGSGKVSVTAQDTTKLKALAGAVGISSGGISVALGGAVAINNVGTDSKKQQIKAQMKQTANSNNVDTDLSVTATNTASLLTLAVGGAVAAGTSIVGVSGQGSVALSNIYSQTDASITNSNIYRDGDGRVDVAVTATNKSAIMSSADALSVTGNQVAAAAGVSKVTSDADTYAGVNWGSLNPGWISFNVNNLQVQATSDTKITNVGLAVSAAIKGSASLAGDGNVAINKLSNDTTAELKNTYALVYSNLAVQAESSDVLKNYSGTLSVGASGSAGVAMGATVAVNEILGSTSALVENSILQVLGRGSNNTGVGINTYTPVSYDSSSDAKNDAYGTATQNSTKKKGLVVTAEASHKMENISITAGVGAAKTAGIAVGATVAVNTIGAKDAQGNPLAVTRATISNSSINNNLSLADLTWTDTTPDVTVIANDVTSISNHVGTLTVGGGQLGLGVAAAVETNTIARATQATIDNNATEQVKLKARDVLVNATNAVTTLVTASGLGVGGGLAGLSATGVVAVDKFTNSTTALVNGMDIYAHSIKVDAERVERSRKYTNAATGSGGEISFSLSAGVAILQDNSSTEAVLTNGTVNTYGDNDDVQVVAHNNAHVNDEVGSAALAIGIGGAAGVTVGLNDINATVSAKVSAMRIGQANDRVHDITVAAENNLLASTLNYAAGGGLVGIGVGVGVNTINTDTAVSVNSAELYADNDITIYAQENRYLEEQAYGATLGGGALSTNVMITHIGTALADSYTYESGNSNDTYSTDNIKKQINQAISDQNIALANYGSSAKLASYKEKEIGTARKEGLQTTLANTTVVAGGNVALNNQENNNVNTTVFAGNVGLGSVNVVVGVATLQDMTGITVQQSNLQGSNMYLASDSISNVNVNTRQGAVSSFGSLNVGVSKVTHTGTNKVTLDDSTLTAIATANVPTTKILLQAESNAYLNNNLFGATVSGIAGGALYAQTVDNNLTAIDVGKEKANIFRTSRFATNSAQDDTVGMYVYNNPQLKTTVQAAGVGLASAGGAIAIAEADGAASLDVGDRNTFDTENVILQATTGSNSLGNNGTNTEAYVLGVSAGGVGINVNKARTINNMQAKTLVGNETYQFTDTASVYEAYRPVGTGMQTRTVTYYAYKQLDEENNATGEEFYADVDPSSYDDGIVTVDGVKYQAQPADAHDGTYKSVTESYNYYEYYQLDEDGNLVKNANGDGYLIVDVVTDSANDMVADQGSIYYDATEDEYVTHDGVTKTGVTNLTVQAINATASNVNIEGVTVGLLVASGSNYAQSHTKNSVKIQLGSSAAGEAQLASLNVYASNSDTVTSKANGDGGGIVGISPVAAVVEHNQDGNDKAVTNVTMKGNYTVTGVTSVQALRSDTLNLQADALNATVLGGSGTEAMNNVQADTSVNLTDVHLNNPTSDQDILVKAYNKVTINKDDAFANMVKGNGYGGASATVAQLKNTLNETATLNITGTQLEAKGNINLAALADDDVRVHGIV